MRILGIDPGYAIVGFGILEADRGQARLLGCGAINTPAGVPMPQRLLQIQEDLETLIRRFSPEVMAIEELFFNTNVTTGIGVAQARGVILMTAAKLGVRIFEPGQAGGSGLRQGRKASGHGHDQADPAPFRRPKAG